jgi:cytosine/adenosine deaminase-related metal-dependent hydrolase
MATREGARAIGQENEIGSIEPDKRADFIIVDRSATHLASAPEPFSALVYSARPSDVRTTVVDGELLVDDFQLVHHDELEIATSARYEAAALAKRAF